jgi:hypothetical protein
LCPDNDSLVSIHIFWHKRIDNCNGDSVRIVNVLWHGTKSGSDWRKDRGSCSITARRKFWQGCSFAFHFLHGHKRTGSLLYLATPMT